MKTNQDKQPTPSENPHADSDTNQRKQYEVILTFTQQSRVSVIIEADTLEEAQEKAEEIYPDEVEDWNPVNDEVSVESVEPIKEGKTHE